MVRTAGTTRTHELRLDATLVSRIDSIDRTDTLQRSSDRPGRTPRRRVQRAQVPARIAGVDHGVSGRPSAPSPRSRHRARLSLPVAYAAESADGVGAASPHAAPRRGVHAGGGRGVAALRELWVAPPDTLSSGTQWARLARVRDLSRFRADHRASTRSFRVLGAESRLGQTLVLVERRSATQLSGSGTQFGEPLQLEAEGEGTMQLWLSLDGGAIRRGEGGLGAAGGDDAGDGECSNSCSGRALTISRP